MNITWWTEICWWQLYFYLFDFCFAASACTVFLYFSHQFMLFVFFYMHVLFCSNLLSVGRAFSFFTCLPSFSPWSLRFFALFISRYSSLFSPRSSYFCNPRSSSLFSPLSSSYCNWCSSSYYNPRALLILAARALLILTARALLSLLTRAFRFSIWLLL